MHFAQFSLIPYLEIDNWSLPNLKVSENNAMVHFEEKFLGGRANPSRLARFSLIHYLKIDNWSLPNLEVGENDAIVHFEEKFWAAAQILVVLRGFRSFTIWKPTTGRSRTSKCARIMQLCILKRRFWMAAQMLAVLRGFRSFPFLKIDN